MHPEFQPNFNQMHNVQIIQTFTKRQFFFFKNPSPCGIYLGIHSFDGFKVKRKPSWFELFGAWSYGKPRTAGAEEFHRRVADLKAPRFMNYIELWIISLPNLPLSPTMICSHLENLTPSPSLKVCWDLSNVFQDMSHQQPGKQEVYRHNNQGPTTANSSRKTDVQLRSMTWNIQYKPIGSVFLADRMVWKPSSLLYLSWFFRVYLSS